MAIGIVGNTIKTDYMITKTIRISSNTTTSINVKVIIEFKNNLPNTAEEDLYKAGVLGYILVGAGLAVYSIAQLLLWAASNGAYQPSFSQH